MRSNLLVLVLLFSFLSFHAQAQKPKRVTSGEIYAALQKLEVLGTVLYLAAHPDDENTRLISYLSNELKANTNYLSLTRGDGGQNLIGTEIRELLGVIRTQELLMARSIDGGLQYFSRANDFGYSKHPDETLEIWNKEEVLSDVVWAIRTIKPDVIINRFDHRTPGKTHGHHTSSAMLSHEAFEMAENPSIYPEQLKYTETWKASRLFFNTSWWFYGSREKFAEADKSKLMSVDVGVYYPLLGKSNTEIAAEARSMHKCQGFGSVGTRGSELEFLELLKGEMPPSKMDIFEGINTSWSRVSGGKSIGAKLKTIISNFDHAKPAESVLELVELRTMILQIQDKHWKLIKEKEVSQIIEWCAGLYMEAIVDSAPHLTRGDDFEVKAEIINRSDVPISLEGISYEPFAKDSSFTMALENNQVYHFYNNFIIDEHVPYSAPYWLKKKGTLGLYTVEDQSLIGKAETPKKLAILFHVEIGGTPMIFRKEMVFKKRDPVIGELYKPLEVAPSIAVSLDQTAYIFADSSGKEVIVKVKALGDHMEGQVQLCHPERWNVNPEHFSFNLEKKGEERLFTFTLFPPDMQDEGFVVPLATVGEASYTDQVVVMDYDHIPSQTVIMDASSKVVKIDLIKKGERVAYIMGAGDQVPENLKQIGYHVDVINESSIGTTDYSNYDALILGIRAYNTIESLQFHQDKLLDYVKAGGTMIVQYNTSRRLVVDELGPFPLKLGRARVSLETAPVRLLNKKHSLLNFPNKITEADFNGWVQERGLYFPQEWDDHYKTIISSNDPGEDPRDSGILVARYGEGYYIYTGYSWFRELPAGVPGAYRIFTNMISIGKQIKP